MARVVIVGGGVSGCAAAYTLSLSGVDVFLIEKAEKIGGKTREYGCKVLDKCQNCGVCLVSGLWSKIPEQKNITIFEGTSVRDVSGEPGNYTVELKNEPSCNNPETTKVNPQLEQNQILENIYAVVVATGFEDPTDKITAFLHITGTTNIITGSSLEKLMLKRTENSLFDEAPKSAAFIQCIGSRDNNEGGLYCSKVCCSYSTRCAKVILKYYPDCKITFFYMELQNVESGNYYAGLKELGMDFIKCRPLKITGGAPVKIEYDDLSGDTGSCNKNTGISNNKKIKTGNFDLVILSDGIFASSSNEKHAGIFKLGQDKDGFLKPNPSSPGIYVTGCAKAPMKIDEAYADSVTAANKILSLINRNENESFYLLRR